eukprot:1158328-Pelagomonas_calceolata.AAC.5
MQLSDRAASYLQDTMQNVVEFCKPRIKSLQEWTSGNVNITNMRNDRYSIITVCGDPKLHRRHRRSQKQRAVSQNVKPLFASVPNGCSRPRRYGGVLKEGESGLTWGARVKVLLALHRPLESRVSFFSSSRKPIGNDANIRKRSSRLHHCEVATASSLLAGVSSSKPKLLAQTLPQKRLPTALVASSACLHKMSMRSPRYAWKDAQQGATACFEDQHDAIRTQEKKGAVLHGEMTGINWAWGLPSLTNATVIATVNHIRLRGFISSEDSEGKGPGYRFSPSRF